MKTTCDARREDLLAYRDHELPVARQLVVRWHLAHCAGCREELSIMEQISQQLLEADTGPIGQTAPLDAALRDRILASVGTANLSDDITQASTPGIQAPPIGADRPQLTRTRPVWREMAAIGAVIVLFSVGYTTIMGSRLRAGFSSAASQINTGGATDSTETSVTLPPSGASAGVAASGGSSGQSRSSYGDLSAERESQRNIGGPVRIGETAGAASHNSPLPQSNTAFADSHVKSLAKQRLARRDEVDAVGSSSHNGPVGATGATSRTMSSANTADLPSALRRVHKEARITVAVAKVEEGSDAVESMVKSAGGFIADNTLSTGGDGLKTAALTVRVPVRQFETILGQIAKLGNVKAKNVSGEDITEKFSDADQSNRVLSSELGVKESQLKVALDRAAKDKKHLVEVPWQRRAEVRELRILAAQAQARLELMKKISDLANIAVEIQEQPRPAQQTGLLQDMSDTGYAAFDTFILAARVPLNLFIWILAYCPLWIPLVFAYRYYSRAHLRDTSNP